MSMGWPPCGPMTVPALSILIMRILPRSRIDDSLIRLVVIFRPTREILVTPQWRGKVNGDRYWQDFRLHPPDCRSVRRGKRAGGRPAGIFLHARHARRDLDRFGQHHRKRGEPGADHRPDGHILL